MSTRSLLLGALLLVALPARAAEEPQAATRSSAPPRTHEEGRGTSALAAGRSRLFVQVRDARLMASADPAAYALAVLQPGQPVTWLGSVPGRPRWHRVRADGVEGVMLAQNLSPTRPGRRERPARDRRPPTVGAGTLLREAAAEAAAAQPLPGVSRVSRVALPTSRSPSTGKQFASRKPRG